MGSVRDIENALDLFQNNEQFSSDVVQTLRQAIHIFSNQGRSFPASVPHPPVQPMIKVGECFSPVKKRKFKPPSSKRQQLTAEEAAEIYLMRPKVVGKGDRPKRGSMIKCKSIAPKYGVSAKTIRDIWRGRTWIEATRHLWTREEEHSRALGGGDEDSDSECESGGEDKNETNAMTESRGQFVVPSANETAQVPSFFSQNR